MGIAEEIEAALTAAAPNGGRQAITELSRLLAAVAEGRVAEEDALRRIAGSPQLDGLAAELAGRPIQGDGVQVSFGAANRVGDVHIGTVAGRVVHLHVNVYHRGGVDPAAAPGQASRTPDDSWGPPETGDLARDQPIAAFAVTSRSRVERIISGALAVLLGVAVLIYAGAIVTGQVRADDVNPLFPAAIGLAAIVGGAFYIRTSYRDDRHYLAFSDRLEVHAGDRVAVYPWDDILRGWKVVTMTRTGKTGTATPVLSGLKIALIQQRTAELSLDWDARQRQELEQLVMDQITRRMLPRYRAEYQARGSVEVGPALRLSRQGVLWGGRLVPWQHVERIWIDSQHIYLRTSTAANPLQMRLSAETANYFVFEALVNEIVGRR